MNKIISFLVICFTANFAFSQIKEESENIRRKVQKKTYVGVGGGMGAYQDAKFSNVAYNGISGSFNLGTGRESDHYVWNTDFWTRYSALRTGSHVGKGFYLDAGYSFDYTRKLTENYQLGGKWTLANANFRRFADLGNNSTGIVLSSTVSALGRYTRPINKDLKINFELALGLFSVAREGTSFAYSAVQKVLEEGVFNFQDEATTSPLHLKYASFETIGSLNKIETTLSLDFRKRWRLTYSWDLFNYRTIKGYPLTIAAHTLSVRFNYINKIKTRTNKK